MALRVLSLAVALLGVAICGFGASFVASDYWAHRLIGFGLSLTVLDAVLALARLGPASR